MQMQNISILLKGVRVREKNQVFYWVDLLLVFNNLIK